MNSRAIARSASPRSVTSARPIVVSEQGA